MQENHIILEDKACSKYIPYFGNVVPCIKNSFYICKVLYIENNLLQSTS